MSEPTNDLAANLEAVREAAGRDPDAASIAADDAGATALAEALDEEAPTKP